MGGRCVVNKLKNILLHRATIIGFSMLVQLYFMITVILRFRDFFVFFYGFSIVLSILVVFWILNDNTNPAYKIAWMIPILLFPLFGGIFYLVFGRSRVSKKMKHRLLELSEKTREATGVHWEAMEALYKDHPQAFKQATYIKDYADSPPYDNTESSYLSTGEEKYHAVMQEIKKAEKYIFLEYFIIEPGEMWDSILEVLIEKVKKGVDVRVIYDDVGCLMTLPYDYDKTLRSYGIQCIKFNPLKPILIKSFNHRDHRKIIVVDGKVGFTGGINLADEYINIKERFGHWKDTAIMIKGEGVWNFTVMFLALWDFIDEEKNSYLSYRPTYPNIGSGFRENGIVQPFGDIPLDNEAVGETVYLNIINQAIDYVYITTPYLVIDNEMTVALTTAAKSGVDVRIITPFIGDKWYVQYITRSNYKRLMDAGVKIYEYTPGFIHSKTYVADDKYGVVGTINMDYRSLYLHFECGVWLYKSPVVDDIKKDFHETLRQSKRMTKADVKNVKLHIRIIRFFLRAFAPLM
ncbi:MAG TPA: cardiolipin synthase [Eubacteriaceae bacterium]|nr:cardiolipin synthase [Eubacteriaceae bacterium]